MYQEYLPDIRLRHLIETYWVADGFIEKSFSERIMPDGCVDIILNFGNNDGTGKLKTGLPEMIGTMTSPLSITYEIGYVQMMGIRFAPGGITAFTQIPIFELTNQNIELPFNETLFDYRFFERLPSMNSMSERINYINYYFLSCLYKLYLPDQQIQYAISLIRKNNGLLPIKQLAGDVCLSERQLERKFKFATGISPKQFSNITRFGYTCQYLKTHQNDSIFDIAVDCGYHDHSHMNKEFQRLGNISPSEYF